MTNMRRRTFLSSTGAGLLGMSLGGLSLGRAPLANAAEPYAGPFWVFLHASGGWDPQFLFNPTDRPAHNRRYTEIGKVGNIPYAGWDLNGERLGLDAATDYSGVLYSPRSFLERHGKQLTVINGIDLSTNNHDSGARVMASGKLTEGYPALGAMVASSAGKTMPLAFLAGGGYDSTMGLVPAVRLRNVGVIERIVDPNLFDPSDPESDAFHSAATWERIRKAQLERMARLRMNTTLPVTRDALVAFSGARVSDGDLRRLKLPEPVDVGAPGLGSLEGAMRQAQLAVAAFKGGLAISAGLSIGGFDTHGDHDSSQTRQLAQLLGAVGFLLDELAANGLSDQTYVIVTSDFGRGPAYNGEGDGSGKDHWPISSMLAFGPKIAGNRVVGDTDDDQRAIGIDPGAPVKTAKDGVIVTPQHVHIALRKLAGVSDEYLLGQYPLSAETIDLFG